MSQTFDPALSEGRTEGGTDTVKPAGREDSGTDTVKPAGRLDEPAPEPGKDEKPSSQT